MPRESGQTQNITGVNHSPKDKKTMIMNNRKQITDLLGQGAGIGDYYKGNKGTFKVTAIFSILIEIYLM